MPNEDATSPQVATTMRIDVSDIRIAGVLVLGAGVVRGLTHASVGLPCPLRAITGVPCPLCGMTTSVTAAATGRFTDAVAANPAGLVAVLFAVALVLRPRLMTIEVPRWVIPAGLSAMWVWEIFRFHVV